MRSRHFFSLLLLVPFLAIGQWVPLNVGFNSTTSITDQNSFLFATSYPNGIKRSANGGGTWSNVNSGLPMSGSNIFARSVGSNGAALFTGTHDGIYRSLDDGNTWTVANGTLAASSTIYAKRFYTFGGSTFAVFTGSIMNGGGIYRTTNNGTSWTVSHVGMGTNVQVNNIVSAGPTLYAATSSGLYSSVDNGMNWVALGAANYAIYSVAHAGSALVIIGNFGYQYSTNNGTSWNNASGGISNPTAGDLIAFDGKVFANTISNQGVLRSLDNGATWSAYNTGLTAVDMTSVAAFHIDNDLLYLGALLDIYSLVGSSVSVDAVPDQLPQITYDPGSQTAYVQVVLPFGSRSIIAVHDALGKLVTRTNAAGRAKVPIAMAGLADGVYHLRLEGSEVRSLGKVVVADH